MSKTREIFNFTSVFGDFSPKVPTSFLTKPTKYVYKENKMCYNLRLKTVSVDPTVSKIKLHIEFAEKPVKFSSLLQFLAILTLKDSLISKTYQIRF